jgi:chaperone required for assembly of F1-ATPase
MTRGKPQNAPRPKRFWQAATAGPQGEHGFPVLLDGRQAKTPYGAALALPTLACGRLVAGEWDAMGETLDYSLMPATRLAYTAIDRVSAARDATAAEIARYAQADVLCYFAEGPAGLTARQEERWGPMLVWAERALGLKLVRGVGITHQPQPPETLGRVQALALELDDFSLTGLAWAAALFGSAVLAIAVQRKELSGEAAFDLSRLDEGFQAERWGEDEEAAARTAALRVDVTALQRWFESLS